MARFRARRAGGLVLVLSIATGSAILFSRRTSVLASPGAALGLTPSSFRANGEIPTRFTCEGADVSPALSWDDPPAGTRSFALIVNDPDAPGGDFVHWVIYDLPASMRSLPEGVGREPDAAGGRQGINSFGKNGYNGPCPPPGKRHRYFFRLWALDADLNLQRAGAQDLVSAAQGHILARGEVMGWFRR